MTPRTRLVARAAAIILVAGVIVAVIVEKRHGARSAPQTPRVANSMANIPNMPGMSDMPVVAMPAQGTVMLTPAQAREFGVTLGTVEMRPLVAETRATGVVTFDETRIAQVASKFGGFIERLYVSATGQPVGRGQPLFDIYSPDLLAAQQELLVAEQLQRSVGQSALPGVPPNTTDLVAAAKRRLALLDISESQIDEVLRSGRVRRALTLLSPASGIVVTKNVVEGQAVTAGQQLYTIADLSDVWVDVQLREADAAAARVGSGADIEITGLSRQPFKGRVAYVYPTLDTTSRAVRARIVVANTGHVLKPGMYATVRLRTASRPALALPTSAVLRTGTRNIVFVDMGKGQLMPVQIQVGRAAGEYTEVLAGLEPGQRVVTSSQFLLDSESNLGEVMCSMISQMPR